MEGPLSVPVGEMRLEYSNVGEIVRKTETIGGATLVYDYTYNAMDRLLRVESGNGTLLEAYTYDVQGNRLTQFNLYQDIGNRTYDYDDEDRLLQAGDTTFNYNVDGFLTQKVSGGQTTTYTYSTRGETKEVALASGTVVSYHHDVLGRPTERRINGNITHK